MMLPSHGPEPCASANSATSAHCGRWDLNPHEHTPTRSLVLPVCQFQHSRLLLFNFACQVSRSLTKHSIAQALRECKHFFVFLFFFICSNYSYIFIVSFCCKIMYFIPILPLRSSLEKFFLILHSYSHKMSPLRLKKRCLSAIIHSCIDFFH